MKFSLKTLLIIVAIVALSLGAYKRLFRWAYCYEAGGEMHYVLGARGVMMPGSGWSTVDGPIKGHPTTRQDVDQEYFDSVECLEAYQVEDGNWIVLRQDSFGKKHGSDPVWTIWSDEFYRSVVSRPQGATP